MTGGGRRPFTGWGRFELTVLAIAAVLAVLWAVAGEAFFGLFLLAVTWAGTKPGFGGPWAGGSDGGSFLAQVRAGMARDLCRRSYLDQTRAAGRQDDPDDDPKEGR